MGMGRLMSWFCMDDILIASEVDRRSIGAVLRKYLQREWDTRYTGVATSLGVGV